MSIEFESPSFDSFKEEMKLKLERVTPDTQSIALTIYQLKEINRYLQGIEEHRVELTPCTPAEAELQEQLDFCKKQTESFQAVNSKLSDEMAILETEHADELSHQSLSISNLTVENEDLRKQIIIMEQKLYDQENREDPRAEILGLTLAKLVEEIRHYDFNDG
ncbi:MAG: hypothetical protein COA47_10120 [Robiginitomaculum sp.]|nr:MAG: hypothetical protein COA47_10120 [Robiginitomaculum sp.]